MDTVQAEPSDQALVAGAQAGNDSLFVVLMQRHNRSVYRVVRGVVRDEAAVEEVMQDAYVHAFTHLKDLSGGGAFSTWLRKIAFREALHRVRRTRSSPFSDVEMESMELASPLAGPDREASRAQLRVALEEAVDRLPDGYREVFMLRSVDGCSVAETAQTLGVLEETVKTRLFRARAKLQQTLSEWVDREAADIFAFHATRCARVGGQVMLRLRPN